ncbi:MAG: YihY/virulence factor BrkB family protein [Paracoccaceae bacterium]
MKKTEHILETGKDLWAELGSDRIGLISAGIAFYGLLSLFPGIAVMLSLGGLLTEPQDLVDSFQSVSRVLPPAAAEIIFDQATAVAGSRNGGLGLTALVGLALALYSSSKAVASLIQGVHVAYDETDDRGFIASLALTLAMTLVFMTVVLLGVLSTIGVPVVLSALALDGTAAGIVALLRWPVLGALTALALGILYRYSVRHQNPRVQWFTPGAVISAVLWIVGSWIFSLYVQNFANYNETFGTLGGVVSLLMWMWLSAYVILLGAEMNTVLAPKGAKHADGKTAGRGRMADAPS